MSAGLFNPGAGLAAPTSNMPNDPAGELLARQKIAALLAKSGPSYADTSPKQHWLQALAQTVDGAMQGLSAREALAAQLAQSQIQSDLAARYPGGAGSTGSLGSSAARPATPGTQIPGKLGDLDTNNLDVAVRTAMAEAGSLGPSGMRDVAAVLRNRALLSGRSVAAEALLPNQFEPWNAGSKNDPRRFKTDSPEYQAALAAIRPVLDGSEADPTGGATFFYAPKAQAALGRSAPKWDDGSGEDRGAHRFFRLPYAGKNPASLAQAAADMPAEDAKPVEMTPGDDGALPRTPDGFAIPPAPGQEGAPQDDLRADLEAAFAAQQARSGAPRADMPVENAQPVAMNAPDAGNGGHPGVTQPAGTPPPSNARLDLAALFSGAPLGPAQSFSGTSGTIVDPDAANMPAQDAQPASASPMQVPLPPARPSDAELQAPAAPGAPSAPSPARQQLYQTIAQPRTDAPDPQSTPGQTPRQGIAALLGGFQDGLDRVFGGPQTQARLDSQGGAKAQIAQALAPAPPAQYASLPPTGQGGPWGSGAGQGGILNRILGGGASAPAPAQDGGLQSAERLSAMRRHEASNVSAPGAAGGRMMGRDDYGRPTGIVDTGGAAGGGQPQPQAQGQQLPARMVQGAPAPAGPQVSSGNTSSGGEAERVAWAKEVMARSAQGVPMGEMAGVASQILKQASQPRYGAPEDYEGGKLIRDPVTGKPEWLINPKDAGEKYQHVDLKNGGVFAFNPSDPDKSKIILPGQPARPLTPEERKAFGIGEGQGAAMTAEGPKAIGGGGTTINVDTKGAGKFSEKANEIQAERYGGMVKAADNAVALRGDIETMSDLAGQISSGKLAEAKLGLGQYAKAVGLDGVAEKLTGGKMSEMEAFSALADKLTPQMRVPGSGSTSDAEGRAFKNSLPSLLKTPGGNAVIADTFRAMADHQARAGEIAGQAIRGEIGQAEADKLIRDLPSPYGRFKEYRTGVTAGEASGASGVQRTPGGTIQPGQTTTINGLQIKRVN